MENIENTIKEYIIADNILLKKRKGKLTNAEQEKLRKESIKMGEIFIAKFVKALNLKESQVYEYKPNKRTDSRYDVRYMVLTKIHMDTFIEFDLYDVNMKKINSERFYSHDIDDLYKLFKQNKMILSTDYSSSLDTSIYNSGVWKITPNILPPDSAWDKITDKFNDVYFVENETDEYITSNQVKASEYGYGWDGRPNPFPRTLSWSEAESKFKNSLSQSELKSIRISYKKEEYADLEEHDTERHLKTIMVSLVDKMKNGGSIKSNHKSLGTAIKLSITPKVTIHDMIADCADCGDKFSYQKSKSNILWECPNCFSKKHIS